MADATYMSKLEILSHLPRQPIPTPRQLENGIRAIGSSTDQRTDRYKNMRDQAQSNEADWKLQVRTVRQVFRSIRAEQGNKSSFLPLTFLLQYIW